MQVARRWIVAGVATTLVGVGAAVATHQQGSPIAGGISPSTRTMGADPSPAAASPVSSGATSGTTGPAPPATTTAPATNTGQPKESLRPSTRPVDDRKGKELGTPFTVNGIQVVSTTHRVSAGFKPTVTAGYPLTPAAAKAFAKLSAAARKANLRLLVVSGYRSHNSQAALYRHSLAVNGRAFTTSYVAWPGTSEHQTGLAVDLRSPSGRGTGFDNTREWRWLRAHAQDYGFVLRYPKRKTAITGIGYEPWHWRYVGAAQARAIRALGASTTIEQYLRLA